MITTDQVTVRHEDAGYGWGHGITIKDLDGNLIAVIACGKYGTTVELGIGQTQNYKVEKVKK